MLIEEEEKLSIILTKTIQLIVKMVLLDVLKLLGIKRLNIIKIEMIK